MDSRGHEMKKPQATTPAHRGPSRSVYRSLAAAPAVSAVPLHVQKDGVSGLERGLERSFGKLLGPQTKGPGDVVWSDQKQTKGAEVLPCPIPLIVAYAQHQSVVIESNPVAKVVTAVHELFQQHEVDASFNSAKFKWKCSCYAGECETRFVARLFSVPDRAGFFVLDFQRRGGDAFHFQSVYKAMHFRLLKSGFVVCNDAKAEQQKEEEPVLRTFKPLPLPKNLVVDDDDNSPTDFAPIFRMCSSQYIDVQREGLTALSAQLSGVDTPTDAVMPILGRLIELVSLARDCQVRRLAITTVSKLAVLPKAAEKLSEKSALQLLVKLVTCEEETPETRRQACHTLVHLPRTLLDEGDRSVLRTTLSNSDPRLTHLVQLLLA